jgi:hypothetical protein
MSKSVFQQLVEQTCSNPNFKPSNNKAVKTAIAAKPNGSAKSVPNPSAVASQSQITNHKSPITPLANAVRAENQSAKSGRVAEANRAARCFHVKANGVQCKSPAMRGQPFCFFHEKFYNPPYDDSFPPLEDANSVQCAILQVLNGLKSKLITPLEARVYLYGLKAASINARRTRFETIEDQVTEYPMTAIHRENARGTASAASAPHSADPRAGQDFSPDNKDSIGIGTARSASPSARVSAIKEFLRKPNTPASAPATTERPKQAAVLTSN